MQYLNNVLFKIGGQDITLFIILEFVLVFLIFIIIAKLIKRALNKRLFPHYNIKKGTAKAYSRIINYFIVITGFLIALNAAGVNISLLFAGGAAVLVGIGFGLQNIANNFISGVIILFERPIKEGDFVEVDGMYGTVVAIAARSTRIKTLSDVMIIVPNSFFIEKRVINRSYTERASVDITVTVAYGTDLDKVKHILLDLASSHELVLKEPQPVVRFAELADSGIVVKLWVAVKNQEIQGLVKSDINYNVLKKFTENNIEIPYPHRVVKIEKNETGL